MPLIHEIDYGTPIRLATKQVTLTIDGHEVTVPEGTSIMHAAMDAGIKVPKLCATDSLNAFGSCRLCLIEVEGRNRRGQGGQTGDRAMRGGRRHSDFLGGSASGIGGH